MTLTPLNLITLILPSHFPQNIICIPRSNRVSILPESKRLGIFDRLFSIKADQLTITFVLSVLTFSFNIIIHQDLWINLVKFQCFDCLFKLAIFQQPIRCFVNTKQPNKANYHKCSKKSGDVSPAKCVCCQY